MHNIPNERTAYALETAGIMHAKYTLKVGVNVRKKETSTDTKPVLFALYVNHVVDKFKLLTQNRYKAIHVSAYKANDAPTPTQLGQAPSQVGRARIAQGLPGLTPSQLDQAPSQLGRAQIAQGKPGLIPSQLGQAPSQLSGAQIAQGKPGLTPSQLG